MYAQYTAGHLLPPFVNVTDSFSDHLSGISVGFHLIPIQDGLSQLLPSPGFPGPFSFISISPWPLITPNTNHTFKKQTEK